MAEPAFRPRLPSRGDGRQWPRQGEWTYDDTARLPDDGNRYEVIRGVLYVTPAPNYKHQFVIMNLAASFHEFLAERELGVVLPAPFDILLPREIASPVEPDLVVFRSGNVPDWGAKSFAGVPDLVVEVLSPSTRSRDRRIKLRAYEEAGVPEYWLVDPDLRSILVYGREGHESPGGFVERCRGGVGERVTSAVLPGFELEVARLFPRP
jgi:Uma2 family endonuclease